MKTKLTFISIGLVVALAVASSQAQTNTPIVELVPKSLKSPPSTNFWGQVFGQYAKKITLVATDSIRQRDDSKGLFDL